MQKIKRGWIVVAALVLFFVLTNPGSQRFKEFSGSERYSDFKRTSNWILFSVYEIPNADGKYLGLAMNFFRINNSNSGGNIKPTLVDSIDSIAPIRGLDR